MSIYEEVWRWSRRVGQKRRQRHTLNFQLNLWEVPLFFESSNWKSILFEFIELLIFSKDSWKKKKKTSAVKIAMSFEKCSLATVVRHPSPLGHINLNVFTLSHTYLGTHVCSSSPVIRKLDSRHFRVRNFSDYWKSWRMLYIPECTHTLLSNTWTISIKKTG